MIKKIILYLQAILESSNYFERVFTLCVLKSDSAKGNATILPFHYLGKAQYESVADFDHYNGSAYFRKNGDTTINVYEGILDNLSCGDYVKISVPIRIVICVPREKVSCDNEYADDLLAQTLIRLVQTKSSVLRKSINASSTSMLVTKYSTDTLKILKEETGKNLTSDINYKFIYMAMDLNVDVVINKYCIQSECDVAGVIPSIPTAMDELNVEYRER